MTIFNSCYKQFLADVLLTSEIYIIHIVKKDFRVKKCC